MNTYLLIGTFLLFGAAIFFKFNSTRTADNWNIPKNKISTLQKIDSQQQRTLKLVVTYDYGETLETISENTTPEIIQDLMESINWNVFHIVQLEDKNGNALHVSGSLEEDGLASGYVTENDHLLKSVPPTSVEEMTTILIDFLESENNWRKKYKYE
ncbi:hypothetical protein OQ279_01800 [Salinimicrobium sp. MT39]|uniref:Uncharacterized protein n=1 Tax=Salinimicrobium profundisediminis TaxID=2994553 RepID=A0A9X3HZL4_9FLAO|nr:hypothetical protein [Salinimicrobium profundisediminis]MCX2836871.1 hypothetical protein [Salinimicrobium profundisediminis]